MLQVLLVGGSDFSLIGRPVLSPELVSVHATVIEKALSHIKTVFKKKPRKQFQRINCKHSTGKYFVFAGTEQEDTVFAHGAAKHSNNCCNHWASHFLLCYKCHIF
jgi:hypothetical protein